LQTRGVTQQRKGRSVNGVTVGRKKLKSRNKRRASIRIFVTGGVKRSSTAVKKGREKGTEASAGLFS